MVNLLSREMRKSAVHYIALRTRMRILRGALEGLKRSRASDPRVSRSVLEAIDNHEQELAQLLEYRQWL